MFLLSSYWSVQIMYFNEGRESLIFFNFSSPYLSHITTDADESFNLNFKASTPNKLNKGIEIFPLLKHEI